MILAISVVVAACDGSSSPTEPPQPGALLRIVVAPSGASGETFHVLILDPAVIAEADSLMGRGNVRIVNGRLARGDGGFNQSWSWHMVPETVEFADQAIELCDGQPSDIEADLDYWIDTVGAFCPWNTQVVARVR